MNNNLAQLNVPYNQNNSYSTTYYKPSTTKENISILIDKIGIISGTISALFIAIILYSIIRMILGDIENKNEIDEKIKEYQEKELENSRNPRWELIENLVTSGSPADWRVAIIEADVLLDEALKYAGFTGNTIGEMLTSAGNSAFRSYQFAWDAHKVRNEIAHSGSNYKLSKDQTVRVIAMYKVVLEEFGLL